MYTAFLQLNRALSGPRNPGVIGDRGSGSLLRESSFAAEWSGDGWLDHSVSDVDTALESTRWSSHPNRSSSHDGGYKPSYRASSYPEQQLQQQYLQQDLSETMSTPNSPSFISFPPPDGVARQPLTHRHSLPLNISSMNASRDSAFSAPNMSPDSGFHFPGISTAHGFDRSMSGTTLGHGFSNQSCNQWSNHASLLHGDQSRILNSVLQQHLTHQNGFLHNVPLLSPRLHLLQQGLSQPIPSLPHLSFLQSQLIAGHASAPSHLLRKYDSLYGIAEMKDHQRAKSTRGKQHRFSRQGSDSSGHKDECIQFSSKYMTAEEIGSILKLQHTSHSNDPYIDDYYHQASTAKKSSGLRLKPHFAPLHLRDIPSRARNSGSDQHGHQSFDTLRKLALSSIRRPHPLLEIAPPSSGCNDNSTEYWSLEQEPLFAARIAVEDAYNLLLDVEDIDRFLQNSPPQDGGSQLRRKRQVLLEALAAALQLVDPFGSGSTVGPGDDIVFMRIVSLPKGCKLVSKYIELVMVTPGSASELSRIVCMAVFRHLRFLYGRLPTDPTASEAVVKLAKVVSTCVGCMDLRCLSACLAAVVCSTEQPPLRPLLSPSGDHASVILKSVLDRATELLNNPNPQASGSWSVSSLSFWKASFGAFFTLLTKYCVSKYDSIMQSMVNRAQSSSDSTSSEAARAIRGEMPVELLRASLFHTDDHQRRMLMAFAHKSIPFTVTGFNRHNEENVDK
ncbi:hypothetical protein RND81_04G068200 [Saponaria officinalis]|uniref:Topoisomerase II-associated protein PAT1 n=1 Tax=Saponaria officinalis TaxID=3572 RepID=A0AAW1LK80_SAPOF